MWNDDPASKAIIEQINDRLGKRVEGINEALELERLDTDTSNIGEDSPTKKAFWDFNMVNDHTVSEEMIQQINDRLGKRVEEINKFVQNWQLEADRDQNSSDVEEAFGYLLNNIEQKDTNNIDSEDFAVLSAGLNVLEDIDLSVYSDEELSQLLFEGFARYKFMHPLLDLNQFDNLEALQDAIKKAQENQVDIHPKINEMLLNIINGVNITFDTHDTKNKSITVDGKLISPKNWNAIMDPGNGMSIIYLQYRAAKTLLGSLNENFIQNSNEIFIQNSNEIIKLFNSIDQKLNNMTLIDKQQANELKEKIAKDVKALKNEFHSKAMTNINDMFKANNLILADIEDIGYTVYKELKANGKLKDILNIELKNIGDTTNKQLNPGETDYSKLILENIQKRAKADGKFFSKWDCFIEIYYGCADMFFKARQKSSDTKKDIGKFTHQILVNNITKGKEKSIIS